MRHPRLALWFILFIVAAGLLATACGPQTDELGAADLAVSSNGHGHTKSSFTVTTNLVSGSTLSGAVVWTASPAGTTVAQVEFAIDGALRWTERLSPYQFNGDPSGTLDTRTLADGAHVLTVTAVATDGRTATAQVQVTIANGTAPAPAPSPSTSLGAVPRYGTANGWRLPFRSSADQDFEIGQDVQLGAKLVRIDGTGDTIIDKLIAKGIEPVCLLGSNPTYPWSKTAEQFGAEAGQRAAALKGKVRFFEPFNEPNLHGWSPDTYLPYLKAAYVAIKAANPDAIVLHAGMWTSSSWPLISWVDRLYALGGGAYFDVMNVHLYDDAAEHGAWSIWDMTYGSGGAGYYDTKNVRSIMNAHGDAAKAIVATEAGGPVPKYSLTKQATIVTHALQAADGVGTGYRKTLFTLIYNVLDDDVAGFGLLDLSLNRRPSWTAFSDVAHAP